MTVNPGYENPSVAGWTVQKAYPVVYTVGVSALTAAIPALGIGSGLYRTPTGLRAHAAFDNALEATDTSITYRFFVPCSDQTETDCLPIFAQQMVGTNLGAPDNDAPNDLLVGVAVENGATIVPGTVGGQALFTVPKSGALVTLDSPLVHGALVTAKDKNNVDITLKGYWMRTYVQVPASVAITASITSASPTVTTTAADVTWRGRLVTGTGIPTKTYVGAVIAGTSFQLVNSPSATAILVNATATNGTAALTVRSTIPLNLGPLSNADALTTGTGANLTLVGSGSVSGGSGSFMFGPIALLGKKQPAFIGGVVSNSILDGYSDDFHSSYWGPFMRAAVEQAFPAMKLSRGGESAKSFSNPSTRRLRHPLTKGVNRWLLEYLTNDQIISSAAGVTNAQDLYQNIGYYLISQTPDAKLWPATVPPRTSSTDAWATTANQTVLSGSQIAYLAQFNDWLRTIPAPFTGVLDLADLCMSSRNSGLWVPGGTGDGVHPSDALMRGSITTAVKAITATW